MNEKLKEAVKSFVENPENSSQWRADYFYAKDHIGFSSSCAYYALLAAAARGEIPGFQLVPVEPTEKMYRSGYEFLSGIEEWPGDWYKSGITSEAYGARGVWDRMLTAYKEEQT